MTVFAAVFCTLLFSLFTVFSSVNKLRIMQTDGQTDERNHCTRLVHTRRLGHAVKHRPTKRNVGITHEPHQPRNVVKDELFLKHAFFQVSHEIRRQLVDLCGRRTCLSSTHTRHQEYDNQTRTQISLVAARGDPVCPTTPHQLSCCRKTRSLCGYMLRSNARFPNTK